LKTPSVILSALLLLPVLAGSAVARDRDHGIHMDCCEDPVVFGPRHAVSRAYRAITTDDGHVTLLITGDVIAMQFSERTQRHIERELRDAEYEDDDGVLGNAIKSAVLSGVRSMLRHSAEISLDEVDAVRYRDGALVIVARDGSRPFEDATVDDRYVMEEFSRQDALRFVRTFERLTRR